MKIAFLYSELAGYVVACLNTLLRNEDVQLLLIRWPINQEAPFQFDFDQEMQIFNRHELTEEDMLAKLDRFQPDGIVVSGWMDKGYLKVSHRWKQKGIPVIGGMDNQWQGNLRQHVGTMLSPFLIKKYFDYLWVPGRRQYEYARRLGFTHDQIKLGYYCADTELFEKAYQNRKAEAEKPYPHTLLYLGRLVSFKGIEELVNAFLSFQDSQWKLGIVGAGEIDIPESPQIERRGFVQPHELPALASETGAFILPSRKEPWGVVLHEFAAAGLPLLASSACGSADAFVKDGYNGFIHQAGNQDSIRKTLEELFQASEEKLRLMGDRSHALAQQMTPEIWASTLMRMIQQF